MVICVQDIEVYFDPRNLTDYKNVRLMSKAKKSGEIELMFEWFESIFGVEQLDRIYEQFKAKNGSADVQSFVEFLNSILVEAKKNEQVKNS